MAPQADYNVPEHPVTLLPRISLSMKAFSTLLVIFDVVTTMPLRRWPQRASGRLFSLKRRVFRDAFLSNYLFLVHHLISPHLPP